ncbi:hypothetical protein EDC04DRAFT_2616893 [Pisolithus marmoratus]|nr:hypothetical protein EDC04DRAFT_2616893 [Pisolithus marmoratus]
MLPFMLLLQMSDLLLSHVGLGLCHLMFILEGSSDKALVLGSFVQSRTFFPFVKLVQGVSELRPVCQVLLLGVDNIVDVEVGSLGYGVMWKADRLSDDRVQQCVALEGLPEGRPVPVEFPY